MSEREVKMKKIRGKTNCVEDELFEDFCREIGVDNIRQYEERELQVQEERAKKRLEFDNQKLRLVNQLEFEKSKDTKGEEKAQGGHVEYFWPTYSGMRNHDNISNLFPRAWKNLTKFV